MALLQNRLIFPVWSAFCWITVYKVSIQKSLCAKHSFNLSLLLKSAWVSWFIWVSESMLNQILLSLCLKERNSKVLLFNNCATSCIKIKHFVLSPGSFIFITLEAVVFEINRIERSWEMVSETHILSYSLRSEQKILLMLLPTPLQRKIADIKIPDDDGCEYGSISIHGCWSFLLLILLKIIRLSLWNVLLFNKDNIGKGIMKEKRKSFFPFLMKWYAMKKKKKKKNHGLQAVLKTFPLSLILPVEKKQMLTKRKSSFVLQGKQFLCVCVYGYS